MKISSREAASFCRAPAPDSLGVLLYGPDLGLTAARRQDLVGVLLGDPIDDLRIERLGPDAVRRDDALLHDVVRARGLLPGRRVLLIEGATDGVAKSVTRAVDGASADDAFLVLCAGPLPPRSSLRKLFEEHKKLAAVQLFADAPDGPELERRLQQAGLRCGINREGLEILADLARSLDHGSIEQLLETIALYAMDSTTPLNATEVLSILPMGHDAGTERLVDAIANGQPEKVGPLIRRLAAAGVGGVAVLIALQRQFRRMLMIASTQGGIDAGLGRVRPPLRGPRRSATLSALRRWDGQKLEAAIRLIYDADRRLRSASPHPEFATIERCALRLAMMASRP